MKVLREVGRFLLLVLVFAVPVWAADAPEAPIEMPEPGKIACPTCLTESGGVNAVTLNDLPSGTADQWAAKIGTPSGTGEFVRASGPTIGGATLDDSTVTGTFDASAAESFDLPADAVDSIDEIANSILGGSTHGPKLATQVTSPTANRCARFNSDGVLESHSGDCSTSTPIPPAIFIESQFPIPAGEETTFVSLAGNISATSANAQSLAFEAMTIDECCFVYTGDPGTGVTVTVASGTYGGSLSDSSISVSLVTTNTPVCDSDSLALTQAQGVNVKVEGASDTGEGQLRGACKRTA